MRTMSQCRTVRVKSSKQFLRLGLVVLTLMAATASASTIYVYDIRMNEGGFVTVRGSHLARSRSVEEDRVHLTFWWTRGHFGEHKSAAPAAPQH